MPQLPQELIDAIIAQVDDRKTLRACSLLASSSVFPSQSLLFHTIDLNAPRIMSRKEAYARFLHVLKLNPHLGTYVRSLRLGDDSDCFVSRSWIAQEKDLPQLFPLLPQLKVFSLTFNSDDQNWTSMPAETRSAFARLFLLPSLQAVSLELIRGFPTELLCGLTRLKQLSLSCVEVDVDDDMLSHSVSELRGLHLRGTPPPTIAAISRCLPKSSPPTLRRLAITPTLEPGFCIAIRQLMIAVGSHITHFEWLPSIHFSPSSAPIDLNTLPHLRFLRFIISFRKFQSRGQFAETIHLLDQISENVNNQVEIIELQCNGMQRFSDNEALEVHWMPLEKVLDKVGFRNKLKEVRVMLPVGRYKGIGLVGSFLSLRERGVVISIQNQTPFSKNQTLVSEKNSGAFEFQEGFWT